MQCIFLEYQFMIPSWPTLNSLLSDKVSLIMVPSPVVFNITYLALYKAHKLQKCFKRLGNGLNIWGDVQFNDGSSYDFNGIYFNGIYFNGMYFLINTSKAYWVIVTRYFLCSASMPSCKTYLISTTQIFWSHFIKEDLQCF